MHDRGSTDRTPRWVKAAGLIVAAFLLLLGGLHLVGGSLLGHTPGGHGNRAPQYSATEHDRHRP